MHEKKKRRLDFRRSNGAHFLCTLQLRERIANMGLRYYESHRFDGSRSHWAIMEWTAQSLRWLYEHGQEIAFVDGTFDVSEPGLVSTVIGVVHTIGGHFLPCAIFLSDSREEETYRDLLSHLMRVRLSDEECAWIDLCLTTRFVIRRCHCGGRR